MVKLSELPHQNQPSFAVVPSFVITSSSIASASFAVVECLATFLAASLIACQAKSEVACLAAYQVEYLAAFLVEYLAAFLVNPT